MDVSAIRQALATAADTITGLTCYGYSPDSADVPALVMDEVELDYNRTMRGLVEAVYTVRLYVSRADDRAGQATLDAYLAPTGSTSVKAALESDKTLGGRVSTIRVERAKGYGRYELGTNHYYGAELDVRVWGV